MKKAVKICKHLCQLRHLQKRCDYSSSLKGNYGGRGKYNKVSLLRRWDIANIKFHFKCFFGTPFDCPRSVLMQSLTMTVKINLPILSHPIKLITFYHMALSLSVALFVWIMEKVCYVQTAVRIFVQFRICSANTKRS